MQEEDGGLEEKEKGDKDLMKLREDYLNHPKIGSIIRFYYFFSDE